MVAVVVSVVFSWLAGVMGAFKSVQGISVASSAQMLVNLRHVLTYGAGLVGFSYRFDAGGLPKALQEVHVIGALVIVACCLLAVARLVRGVVRPRRAVAEPGTGIAAWWLDDALF